MSVSLLGAELVWKLPLGIQELTALLRSLHAAAKKLRPMPNVELLLVRDAEIAHYNAQFMHCIGPTNILSFPADLSDTQGEGNPVNNPASLLLSVDTLQREAFLYGETALQCLLRLLAHGIGHVSGLDHGPEMDVFCHTLLKLQQK